MAKRVAWILFWHSDIGCVGYQSHMIHALADFRALNAYIQYSIKDTEKIMID